jgi:hypothetical protein
LFLGSLSFFAAVGFAQAPSSLTVKAATKQKVDLNWTGTASSYKVQRRVLGGSFADVATVSGLSYSDPVPDPSVTYQYQIAVVSGSFSPSNNVTVGPPPAGFSLVDPAPGAPGSELTGNFGQHLSAILDGNGDPAFAFVFEDPNLDSNYSDTQLRFKSWNRAAYKWNDDVILGTIGEPAQYFHPIVSLAFDASTSTWAVAGETNVGESVQLYTSANGTTWTLKTTFSDPSRASYGPSMALAGGKIFLAYGRNLEGIHYITGQLSAGANSWQDKVATLPSGTTTREGTCPRLPWIALAIQELRSGPTTTSVRCSTSGGPPAVRRP